MSSVSLRIPNEVARLWVKNYQTNLRPLLDPSSYDPQVGETNSLWFPIDGWNAMTQDLIAKGATGIRVYFAAYSQTATLAGETIPPDANGNLTLVMVGTQKNADDIEVDMLPDVTGGKILAIH